jgi:hypothetical protein
VGLGRQHDRPHRSAIAANGRVQTLGQDGERAGVVVSFAVNQKQRSFDFIREPEGRHFGVHVGNLPERAAFGLKTERRQGAVIRPAFGYRGAKQFGVGQQVGGHERAIAMSEDADAIAVGNAHLDRLVHSRPGVHHELFEAGIVDGVGTADHGHESAPVPSSVTNRNHVRFYANPDCSPVCLWHRITRAGLRGG